MKAQFFIASVTTKTGSNKNGPWSMTTAMMLEAGKVPNKCNTPIALSLSKEQEPLKDQIDNTLVQVEITELTYDDYSARMQARGIISKADGTPMPVPAPAPAPSK